MASAGEYKYMLSGWCRAVVGRVASLGGSRSLLYKVFAGAPGPPFIFILVGGGVRSCGHGHRGVGICVGPLVGPGLDGDPYGIVVD